MVLLLIARLPWLAIAPPLPSALVDWLLAKVLPEIVKLSPKNATAPPSYSAVLLINMLLCIRATIGPSSPPLAIAPPVPAELLSKRLVVTVSVELKISSAPPPQLLGALLRWNDVLSIAVVPSSSTI